MRAALVPMAFTSMNALSLALLMCGWFLFLVCAAAVIGICAESRAATRCSLSISMDLIYQSEIKRDPGLSDRLKKQAEEAGIAVSSEAVAILTAM